MNKIRILLADDHIVIRKGLCLLLESHPGFKLIAEASNGREAVAMAEGHKPDIAILDIAMPLLNGIEAALCSAGTSSEGKLGCGNAR
jgi:YesN/AraC family two-component response regulator